MYPVKGNGDATGVEVTSPVVVLVVAIVWLPGWLFGDAGGKRLQPERPGSLRHSYCG